MQELSEDEVTEVRVIDQGVPTEEVGGTEPSDRNPFHDHKAINAWQQRAMALLLGSRVSPHRGGHAGERTIQHRRARNKVAKASRRANRP